METNTKKCKKCEKELPINNSYFPPDKGCKDGFRNICKVCSGESKSYNLNIIPCFKWNEELEEKLMVLYFEHTYEWICENVEEFKNSTPKHLWDKMDRLRKKYPNRNLHKNENSKDLVFVFWSKAQVDKLIEIYPNFTNEEILKMDEFKEFTLEKLSNKVKNINETLEVRLSKNEFSKTKANNQRILKITGLTRKLSDENKLNMSISRKKTQKWQGSNNPKFGKTTKGILNGNWKGGKTPIYLEFRKTISNWKNESMKHHDYKCIITGENFDVIHHTTPFRDIVDEVFLNLKLPIYEKVEDYSLDEFKLLENEIIRLHEFYGLGACLTNDIHREFHDIYGYVKATKDDFIEFCKVNYGIEYK